MQILPTHWYRIPNFNGYEYCFGTRQIRSWKQAVRTHQPRILVCKNGEWTLTGDDNKKHTVEYMYIECLILANPIIDGTNSINFNPRRHLAKQPGFRQTDQNIDRSVLEERFIPSFDALVVKEDQ